MCSTLKTIITINLYKKKLLKKNNNYGSNSDFTHHQVKCSIVTVKAEIDTKLWIWSAAQPAVCPSVFM